MESEASLLPCSQEATTGPSSDADESTPHHHTLFNYGPSVTYEAQVSFQFTLRFPKFRFRNKNCCRHLRPFPCICVPRWLLSSWSRLPCLYLAVYKLCKSSSCCFLHLPVTSLLSTWRWLWQYCHLVAATSTARNWGRNLMLAILVEKGTVRTASWFPVSFSVLPSQV